MDQVIRKIQLVAVAFILIATSIGFLIEVHKMIINQNVDLADLLLLFIYISRNNKKDQMYQMKNTNIRNEISN